MTLRTRIAAAAGLSVALAVVAVAVGLYVAVRADLRGELDRGLRDRALVLARPLGGTIATGADRVYLFGNGKGPPGAVVVHPPGRAAAGGRAKGPFPSRVGPVPFGGAPGYVQFIAPNGSVQVPGGQGSTTARIAIDASDRAVARRGSGSALSDRSVKGVRLRVLTEGVGGRGAVMVARPLGEVDSELSKLLLILVIVGACGIALAAALGALVARVALAPVSRFTARTEEVSAESALRSGRLDLSRRLDVSGKDELGRLADSFNRTLDALESSVESQRQLVADAGHELRTPIASLRANIQVLGEAERLPESERESLRADIVSELDELTALVADVVELARGTAAEGREDEVRLDAIVAGAIERARRRAPAMSFAAELEPTVVRGDGTRIDRAVGNLLENARKWSPPEGPIEVGLRGGVVSVRDHGPGFAEDDLPHVFDRFYRADGARRLPGSGLGLAIVRQAAEASGGWARAANAPGGGALLQVSFGTAVAFSAPQG
jgi:two-component system, OmpR family, sensor histidine kinase MprB